MKTSIADGYYSKQITISYEIDGTEIDMVSIVDKRFSIEAKVKQMEREIVKLGGK